MERRDFLKLSAAAALAAPLAHPAIAQTPTTVRWWYHFDNPQNSPAALVAKFEQENPGIKIQAEAIPWGGGNDYQTRLFAALVAGNGPDAAMVRLSWAARFASMKALEPLDAMIAGWAGRSDISENVWKINKGADGRRRQAILPALAICCDLPLLPPGSLPTGQPPATEDLRRVSRCGQGTDEGRHGRVRHARRRRRLR
jgi:hypothetical protein